MFDRFDGAGLPCEDIIKERFLPTGGLIAYSAITNTLADAASLVSRDSFIRNGGFTQDYGVGYEDFELYLRMAISDEPMHVLPEPLFYYRCNGGSSSMLICTNGAGKPCARFASFYRCAATASG